MYVVIIDVLSSPFRRLGEMKGSFSSARGASASDQQKERDEVNHACQYGAEERIQGNGRTAVFSDRLHRFGCVNRRRLRFAADLLPVARRSGGGRRLPARALRPPRRPARAVWRRSRAGSFAGPPRCGVYRLRIRRQRGGLGGRCRFHSSIKGWAAAKRLRPAKRLPLKRRRKTA